jgi:hypothetical protein
MQGLLKEINTNISKCNVSKKKFAAALIFLMAGTLFDNVRTFKKIIL